MMKWDQKYELGHDRIDSEHKIFLGLIIDFQEAAITGAEKEKLIRILNEIVKYAEFHFVSEENIMTENHYPDQQQHAHLHNVLLSEVRDKLHQFRRSDLAANDVFDFLFQWFAIHTTSEDKKLVGYFHGTHSES